MRRDDETDQTAGEQPSAPTATEPVPGPVAVLHRRGLAVAAVLAVAVHLAVLYWPEVTLTGPVAWTDKVVHLAVFAVPAWFVGRVTGRLRVVLVTFAVHAPVSELAQHLVLRGRSGDVWDAVLDLVGVALAAGLLAVGSARRRW